MEVRNSRVRPGKATHNKLAHRVPRTVVCKLVSRHHYGRSGSAVHEWPHAVQVRQRHNCYKFPLLDKRRVFLSSSDLQDTSQRCLETQGCIRPLHQPSHR